MLPAEIEAEAAAAAAAKAPAAATAAETAAVCCQDQTEAKNPGRFFILTFYHILTLNMARRHIQGVH